MAEADSEHASPVHEARAVARTALIGGVIVMAVKLAVFLTTNSAAVLGDALESLVNIAASAMALFSVWYAARPADREHPYGHGKIEFITAAGEGAAIIVSGLVVAAESVRRMIKGAEIDAPGVGVGFLAVIAVGLAGLGWYVHRRGRALDSTALAADGRHLFADAVTTIAVAGSLAVVALTGWMWFDAVAAVVLCAWIAWTGASIIRRAVHGLLDRIDPEDDADIRAILDEEVAAGRIASYEKVRHRHHGADHWVDMHLRFDPTMPVQQAHDTASAIEHRIEQHLGRATATAHIEPEPPGAAESP